MEKKLKCPYCGRSMELKNGKTLDYWYSCTECDVDTPAARGRALAYQRAVEWTLAVLGTCDALSDALGIRKTHPMETVPLETLQRFWAHPVRAFFQMRLQVNFRTEDSEIPDTEPFILEGLSRYQINQQLLNALVEQDDAERLFRRFRAAGDLPYGAFGEIFWETQCQEMQQLADRVIACRQPGQSMEIDLACNGVQITGWLPQVQPDGLLRWRPSLLSVAQGMQLWLEHLVYCASGGNGESRLFLRKDGEWRFPPLAAEQALHYLSQLIEGYREGMSAPLLVLPESGGAWLKTCYDAQNDAMLDDDSTLQKARTKFLQAYEGNMMVRGEGDDIWYQRLWRQLTPETMEAIVEQSQRFLLPLFRFNQS